MSLSYSTITVIGTGFSSRFNDGSLPALPFAYFATVPNEQGQMVLYPEMVGDVPNAGDFAAALFSLTFPNAAVVLATDEGEEGLRMRFFSKGDSVDEYRTDPGQVAGEDLAPTGGHIERIAPMFGITDTELIGELSQILRSSRLDDQFGFGETSERHGEIAQLLDLPSFSVGMGYESIQRGLMPNEITPETLRHFPTDSGFSSCGLRLRQYVLFRPAEGESEAQIAARFLSDVIAWEDDFLEEPNPILGTVGTLQNHMFAAFPEVTEQAATNWLSFLDDHYDLIEVDLGNQPDTGVMENVRIFTLSQSIPTTLLERLCEGTPWSIWSYESRQVVIGNKG
ncbi:MAG: hypothetical protein H8F28_08010 [Fibrella sp.]|nr:hypothetical protein [Armatimonadota bacterium]